MAGDDERERREDKMIQHREDSNVLENNRRRKRKESEQKMDQCEQIFVLVKLNMCLVLRDIFVDMNVRFSFCEKIVNQIKLIGIISNKDTLLLSLYSYIC